jgi:hypothetical protein
VFQVVPLANWCGWLGAHCAAWLFVVFGSGAWAFWAMACNAILPKPDLRFINHIVQAIAGSLIITSLALLSAALGGGAISAGIIGTTLFQYLNLIGTAGCVLLAGIVLFFSSIVFMRLTLRQFLAKVAMVIAYSVVAILTVSRLLATGVRSLIGREPRLRQQQPSSLHERAEQHTDEMYDIPETEIVSNAVRSSIIKEKNESTHPAAVVVEEIAEAQGLH